MTEHTKGPWSVKAGQFNTYIKAASTVVYYRLTLARVAGMCGDEGGYETQQANARLMAAAPKLLEASERALKRLRHLEKDLQLRSHITIELLETAIAKATGGNDD